MSEAFIETQKEIYKRYGEIHRCTGHFLYTSKGHRLIDMNQEGGGAILGWRTGKSKLVFKSLLDRGLTGSFGTKHKEQLERAVFKTVKGYTQLGLYTSVERALTACALYLNTNKPLRLTEDPSLLTDTANENLESAIHLWRPWLPFAQKEAALPKNPRILCSPLPFAGGPVLVAFPEQRKTSISSDFIAPALLGALTRAWHDLAFALRQNRAERSEPHLQKFDPFLSKYWERRGPYLVPKGDPSTYKDLFLFFLDHKILISPKYQIPSLVPLLIDPASLRCIKK